MRADHKADQTIDRAEALERTGATYRQLDYWIRRGYLRVGPSGSGHLRRWEDGEIEIARLMRRLVEGGVSVEVAARVSREIRRGEVNVMLAPGVWIEVTQ